MKKLLFLLSFLFTVNLLYCQIGETYLNTKKSLAGRLIDQKKIGGITVLTIHENDFDIHYFFSNKVCYAIAFSPKSDKALASMIKENNDTCIKRGRKWIRVKDEEIIQIEFKEDPDYGKVFVYKSI